MSWVMSTRGIVDARRPVEHARHLPARIAGAVAGDALHGRDQFVVEDAAIVGPGDGAQLDATIFDLERLHLLGAMRGQAVLQVDAGERRRKLAQIGRRRADQAGELAEAPVGRRDRRIRARAASAPGARHRRGSPRPGSPRSRRSGSGCARSGRARRRRGPTGTGSARRPAARTIPRTRGRSARRGSHPPCSRRARSRAASRISTWVMGRLHDGRRKPLSQPSTRHGNAGRTLTLLGEPTRSIAGGRLRAA